MMAVCSQLPWGFLLVYYASGFEWSDFQTAAMLSVVSALIYSALTWLVLLWRIRPSVEDKSQTCPACGYDLRGTPPGGGSECPECGATREEKG
jgi:hypothetical protein